MRVRRVIFAIVGIALLVTIITPAAVSADTEDNLGKASEKMLKDAQKVDEIIVPGVPPEERISGPPVSSSEITRADAVLSNVPAFDWCYGCSATSAAMMFGYYDRTGYPNMYAGPTNGGVCPLDNSDWGYEECSLSATHQGYDGLAVKGHVDDYWYASGSTVDPYDGNWAEHGYADCTADFMGTNQYQNWQNPDGWTTFYYNQYPSGDPLHDYTGHEPLGKRDGCHGIRLFVESRGYNVIQNYNQRIDAQVPTGGFTYANFKAEIDAGRPVIIHVTNHTMLGYGYDDPDTIYIHDTWDHSDHSMTWGGIYSGREHYGVTVIAVTVTATPSIDLSPSSYGFGDRQVGQCSPDYSFTLTNTGGSTATGSVSLTGTHATQFTITQGSGSFSLGTGASKTIKAKFCPTSTGAKSATIFADGTNCNDDSSSLSGTGVDNTELSYSPASHDFGDKCEGETDSTTFELWNSGTGTLTYSLSESCGWVDVNPTSGSSTGEHDTITVDIDTTGLSEGTHTCDITISSNGGSGTFTVTVNVVPCPETSWTFMVYLDGDNNLEGAGIDDFLEMSSVGSTSDVNIVVQFDRIPGYSSAYDDWTTCKRFLVTQGMTPTPANALMDLGECNMGDPNTLDAFVTWTMTEFPADNYALVLWNHGGGWKSINKWVPWAEDIKDAKDAGFTRGICWDDTNNDYLSLQETEQALTGKYVQLLGYDACLMHMVEVVYQVRTHAAISVGSEEVEPWDGWPYNTILADLTGTPSMSPSFLGETIISRYIESYAYATYETQSAVDKAKVSNLASAVDTLAQVLIDKLPDDYDKIQQVRNGVEEFLNPDFIDLYHFAELIKLYLSDNPAAVAAAQAVMDNVDNTVTAEGHGTAHPNAHGLSIYFPEAEWAYLSSYENTKFAVDTHWDEFLKEYYAPSKPDLIITEKWLCWPDNCTICYNVTNIGDGTAPACHNTALYVDDVEVAHDHVPVDLAPGESYTGCFNGYVWTYTPPSDDITVCADNNEIVDELDEDNNCLTNIWMCGDVTGDGRVRTSDGRRIFRHLTFGDPIDNLWAADVTGDGRVRTSDGRRIFRHLTFGVPLNCKCSG